MRKRSCGLPLACLRLDKHTPHNDQHLSARTLPDEGETSRLFHNESCENHHFSNKNMAVAEVCVGPSESRN
jgi:hypothetical protein